MPDSCNHFSEAWETPLQCLFVRSSNMLQKDKRSGSWRLVVMMVRVWTARVVGDERGVDVARSVEG